MALAGTPVATDYGKCLRCFRSVPWAIALLTLIAAVMAPGSRAGTIRGDRDDQAYLDLAQQPLYEAVGYVQWRQAGSAYTASGVLITDEWVLTAAHVVEGTDRLGAGITGMTVRLDGTRYTAAEWIPHPDWAAHDGNLDAGSDIGLIRLSSRVAQITPTTLYTGTNERGAEATIAGYGNTGNGETGYADGSTGTLRAGRNIVDQVQRATVGGKPLLNIDFDNPTRRTDSSLGSRTPLDLEYLPAPGDSGGGLFIQQDGDAVLAGIVSYISAFDGTTDSDYGDLASFTRVSSYIDWIESIVGSLDPPLRGDFDGDNQLTVQDLDALTRQSLGPVLDTAYDLTGDGAVDGDDRLYWIEELFGTVVGDANFDRAFDSTDLVFVFQAGEYEDLLLANSTWSTGDWDGNGDFNSRDFIFALQHAEFQGGASGAVAAVAHAVPEPCGDAMTLAMALLAAAFRRRQA